MDRFDVSQDNEINKGLNNSSVFQNDFSAQQTPHTSSAQNNDSNNETSQQPAPTSNLKRIASDQHSTFSFQGSSEQINSNIPSRNEVISLGKVPSGPTSSQHMTPVSQQQSINNNTPNVSQPSLQQPSTIPLGNPPVHHSPANSISQNNVEASGPQQQSLPTISLDDSSTSTVANSTYSSSVNPTPGTTTPANNGFPQLIHPHPRLPESSSVHSLSQPSIPPAIPSPSSHSPRPSFQKPFAQRPNSRSSSPAFRPSHAPYPHGSVGSSNSMSDLAPPHPGFSANHAAAAGQSIVRSASTPNVLQAGPNSNPNSPYLSPMNYHQRNASGANLAPSSSRISGRFGSTPRPFSAMSSSSSIDLGSGSGSGAHATDFYSYTNNNRAHGRTQSMAFAELAGSSAFDLSQTFLSANLGPNSSSLVPRMKTIEMYRKNAKKSNDPVIQFQFAQYMLQTALLASTSSSGQHIGKSPSFNALDDPDDFELEFPPLRSDQNGSMHSHTPSNASNISLSNIGGSGANTGAGSGDPPQATLPSPSLGPLTPHDERKIKRALLKEAVSHLRRLADKGYADAQYLLGDAYASGALGKADLKESFALFQLAAKHGHAEASYRTALCLEEGWGTSKDPRKALQFLRQSASRNHPGAMLRLGIACFYGNLGLHIGASTSNKVKTQQEGIKWLTRAADAANDIFPQGPYELAKIYEEGYRDLIFKDLQYSVQLYVKSADLNYVPAASKLGHAYEYGELGCPQDAALSIHYYTIAALGGDPTAMLAMCAWYMVGAEPMLPRNAEEAYEWALRAAERGLAKAQYATGYFLENGIGAERDILQASRWYHSAASGGDERAIERIKNNRILASKPSTKHKKKSFGNLKDIVAAENASIFSRNTANTNNTINTPNNNNNTNTNNTDTDNANNTNYTNSGNNDSASLAVSESVNNPNNEEGNEEIGDELSAADDPLGSVSKSGKKKDKDCVIM